MTGPLTTTARRPCDRRLHLPTAAVRPEPILRHRVIRGLAPIAPPLSLAAVSATTAHGIRRARRRFQDVSQPVGPIDLVVRPATPGPAERRPLEMLALGDSGMAGVGVARPDEALPVQIARRVATLTGRDVHVVGRAESGARTRDVLARQVSGEDPAAVGTGLRPDVVVLLVGTNDVVHLTPPSQLAADTESLLTLLEQADAPVVMSSLPEFRAMRAVPPALRPPLLAWAELVRRIQGRAVRDRAGVRFVDVRALVGAEFVKDTTTMSGDSFHPSAAGYGRIADAMAPVVAAVVSPDRDATDPGPGVLTSATRWA